MNTNREHPLNEASLPRPFALGSAASLYGSSLRPGWLILSLLLLPMTSEANSGTPMMFAGMIQLCLGNALIGLLEGGLISRFLKVPAKRSIGIMIAANYVSMIAGLIVLPIIFPRLDHYDLNNIWFWVWTGVASSFVLTIIIELPFVWFIVRNVQRPVRAILMAGAGVQVLSYLLLIALYAWPMGLTLKTDISPLAELTLPGNVELYYLSPDGLEVLHMPRLDPDVIEVVQRFETPQRRLQVNRTEQGYVLASMNEDRENILETELNSSTVPHFPEEMEELYEYGVPPEHSGVVPHLGEDTPNWQFHFWSTSFMGLTGTDALTGEEARFGLVTVVVSWDLQYPTQLPGGDVIFQLGGDQICIYEPGTKKVALLARGKGPVALLRTTENEPDEQANSVSP